jgi:hypothetical protein
VKTKKYLLIVVVAIVVFIGLTTMFFISKPPAAKANINTRPTSEVSMPLKFRLTMPVPLTGNNGGPITQEELNELIKRMEERSSWWKYNEEENIFERFQSYPGVHVEIKSNNRSIGISTTDELGNFSISIPTDTDLVDIEIHDPESDQMFILKSVQLLNLNELIVDADIGFMLEETAENKEMSMQQRASATDPYWSDGERGATGKRLHCNRFNGPYGNNTYYSNHFSQQTLDNFDHSDCDIAFASSLACLKDYQSIIDKRCAAGLPPSDLDSKEAVCSEQLHEPRTFHFKYNTTEEVNIDEI